MRSFIATAVMIFFGVIFINNNVNANEVFVDKAVFIKDDTGSWRIILRRSLPKGITVEEAAQLYCGKKTAITHLRDCKNTFWHFLPKVVAKKICAEDYFYISQGKIIKKSRPEKETWWGGLFLAQAVLLGLGCLALILLKHNIPAWAFLEFMLTYTTFASFNMWVSSLEISFFAQALAYTALVVIYIKFGLMDWLGDRWLRRWPELENDSKLEEVGESLLVTAIILTPVVVHNSGAGAKLELLAMIFQNGIYIFLFLFLANLVDIFFSTKKT